MLFAARQPFPPFGGNVSEAALEADSMHEAVIVEAVRTPMGRRNGKLREYHPVVLGSMVLKELVSRAGVDPAQVEDVVFGCVMQTGEQSVNVGRNAWLAAGFPVETPATTVDRQCGSSQQAIHFAANLIQSGVAEITIAGGVESMSRVPMGANVVQGPGVPFPPELTELYDMVPQGISAELMARKYGISRREMDEFSVQSHLRAAGPAATGPRPGSEGRWHGPRADAGGPDPGHRRGAQGGRAVAVRHRPLRDQRGLRLGRAGLAEGDRRLAGEDQRERRRDRHR